ADKRIDGLHVVFVQGLPDMLARLRLPLGSTFEKVDDIGLLCTVSEIVSNRRLKDLSYKIAHAPEPRNYLRRIFPRNMHDLRDVEIESKPVRRPHFYCGKLFVQLMGFRLTRCPIKNDVCGRHYLHFVGEGIYRITAWIERRSPHALLAPADDTSVSEFSSAGVDSGLAYECDDNARMAD